MLEQDVSSPINLKEIEHAREWERTAMQRPFREEFFSAFYRELESLQFSNPQTGTLTILELGSGPGFLAEYLLARLPNIQMTLLDNSSAMHKLAEIRLKQHSKRVGFVERDFKDPGWNEGLNQFDAVLTLQAVHELRHKQHATTLHRQVRPLLGPNGIYLYCDHYFGEGAMHNNQLYMSLSEQRQSLESARFQYKEVLIKGGRALYNAN